MLEGFFSIKNRGGCLLVCVVCVLMCSCEKCCFFHMCLFFFVGVVEDGEHSEKRGESGGHGKMP